MKVQEVMTKDVGFCRAEDNLSKAGEVMRQRDCGAIPFVDEQNGVVGMITDRDICLAVSSSNRKAAGIKIAEALADQKVVSCRPDEAIKDVLKKMRKNQIKRLPVVGAKKALLGIISITDILFAAEKEKSLRKKVISTLADISRPHPILLREMTLPLAAERARQS